MNIVKKFLLQKFLIHHYRPKETYATLIAQLQKVKQEKNETVQQYSERLIHTAFQACIAAKTFEEIPLTSANDNIDFVMKQRLILGTSQHISRFLHTFQNKDFADLTEVAVSYKLAEKQEETNRRSDYSQSSSSRYCSHCKTATHVSSLLCELGSVWRYPA